LENNFLQLLTIIHSAINTLGQLTAYEIDKARGLSKKEMKRNFETGGSQLIIYWDILRLYQKFLLCTADYARIYKNDEYVSRFEWSRGLRPRAAATLLLRLWVRIPPGV